MPNPIGWEVQSLASGVRAVLASIPAHAEAFRIRVEGATCRWSTSATPNASVGILMTPADPPRLLSVPSLGAFLLFPLAAAQFNIEYLQGADQFLL